MRVTITMMCAAVVLTVAAVAMVAPGLMSPVVAADPPTKPKTKPVNPAEIKRLDTKLEEVSGAFIRDTTSLITSYEAIGQFERAKVIVEALQKLDPKNEQIKAKLTELSQQILDANEFELEIEPGSAWKAVGLVSRERPIRVEVTGDYKLSASVTTTADGVPSANPALDLVAGVPLGAVMGVVLPVDEPTQAGQGGRQNDKQPKPFLIGSRFERGVDRDGMLYLKVNLPPGTKCVGELKARVSGPQK
jgi:hypothetical protein